MKALPYFQWYPSDADTDENFRAMSDEEIGFYVRCLNHAWMNDGLPVDPEERSRILKTPLKIANSRWVRVGRCFQEIAGRYVNRRQEEERTKAQTKSESATKSVRSRYERRANVALRASESESVSDSSVNSGGGAGGTASPRLDPLAAEAWAGFITAWGDCGGAGCSGPDWVDAAWEWSRMDFEQRVAAIRGLAKRKGADDPALRGLPKNFLEKRKWERDIQTDRAAPPRREDKADAALKLMKERSQ